MCFAKFCHLFPKESQGSKQGDNYTAALYRVSLSGYTLKKNEGKKSKWEKVVICKRLPDSPARREAYKSENLFRQAIIKFIAFQFLAILKKRYYRRTCLSVWLVF